MTSKTCPVCERKLTSEEFAPFCCKRCADVDLSRWLKGGYVIPGGSSEVADDNAPGETRNTDEN